MADEFSSYREGLSDVADNAATVTPNDSADLSTTARALYIGARGGTTLELTGRIHQLIVRGATTAGNLLDQTEAYVARKTGVTL